MESLHHFLLLSMFLHYAVGFNDDCVKILPNSINKIFVEVGKNFTATCHVREGSDYTSNDIEWLLGNISIGKQYYHKINETSSSVTVNVSSNINGWLFCKATRNSLSFKPACRDGIFLQAGYPPLKPKNLTCIAVQEGMAVSTDLTCYWEPGSRDPLLITSYTLYAEIVNYKSDSNPYTASCNQTLARSCTVNLITFPNYMDLRVSVEVKNALGSVWSEEHLCEASSFVKPNPPLDVQVLAEDNFSTSLLITWKHPVNRDTLKLSYVIRYCQVHSNVWTEVPKSLIQAGTESYRLQSLEPYTEYVVQMRCIQEEHHCTTIHWSDWSANATIRTTEAVPANAPDLWRIIQPTSDNRNVTLLWKPPVKANGKILQYILRISQDHGMIERHPIKADNFSMELPPGKWANIEITAVNSVGVSPKATLFIPRSNQELPGVESLSWSVRDEELQVEWSGIPPLPSRVHLSEYLVEWVNVHQKEPHPQWQRVPHNVNTTTLTGFEEKKRYNISVYPIYKHRLQAFQQIQAGRPVTVAAYIRQGSPEKGPNVKVDKSKKNSAELTWEEIPLDSRCGFITNYTIFYRTGDTEHSVTVDASIHSYVLTDLASETEYVVFGMASTVAGSKNGTDFNFKTMKYGDGEVEVIVVVVCLSFLFLTVFIIMFCLRKREVIKQLLWPQVPDPSDSSIAHWSPDFPVKADMPKEDVSVVEVDVFDGKSLCEEDKAVLPLKKDKYLSEEHSSGIGGSSCMSSPRHSVSDSDESDSGQTTASTVQYSSVVASGYKGQTPNHQPPVFARSESTQPLLDCEEHPDLLNESGGHSRNSYFRRGRELEPGALTQECDEPNGISLTFCPVQEEEMSPIIDDPPASGVSYMPQQSGYRPQ